MPVLDCADPGIAKRLTIQGLEARVELNAIRCRRRLRVESGVFNGQKAIVVSQAILTGCGLGRLRNNGVAPVGKVSDASGFCKRLHLHAASHLDRIASIWIALDLAFKPL